MAVPLDRFARSCTEYVEDVITKVVMSLSWMTQVWEGKYVSLNGESARWTISSSSKKIIAWTAGTILATVSIVLVARPLSQGSAPHLRLLSLLPQSKGFSIKPIAYVFPQYYPFEENNRLWGENFTDWTNVVKVTHNQWGLETVRPDESVGYYNGLDFSTRQRQGKFIKDIGFYGLVYHHYWLTGKPIMTGVLEALLRDGEPNVPFMLSWANEPWIWTWDGATTPALLIDQLYGGVEEWREHFDWLLPYFKHPNYIRSQGKVQFVIYRPSHIDNFTPGIKKDMYASFRNWAVEEGLGGMDIIESRIDLDHPLHAPDAVNEFQPHSGGMNHEYHHIIDRNAKIYHRGSMVCWDSTPRHPTDGKAVPRPTCQPHSWQYHMMRLMGRIKQDPNPQGVENFLFVNALNEWGEGNVLEPSVQFGTQYGEAMKAAIAIADKKYLWQHEATAKGLARMKKVDSLFNTTIAPLDVCVVIRATEAENGFGKQFPLDDMIYSLQRQTNENWRAIVFDIEGFSLTSLLIPRMEPRLRDIVLNDGEGVSRTDGTKYVLSNLKDLDPACASAKYILVTNGGNNYSPTAFEIAKTADADFVAMNVESKWTLKDENMKTKTLCSRLQEPSRKLYRPSTAADFDLSATFMSMPKLLSEVAAKTLEDPLYDDPKESDNGMVQEYSSLAQYFTSIKGWTWSYPAEGSERHVLHNPSYTGCQEAGHIWLDSLEFPETGCYNTPGLLKKHGEWKHVDLDYYRRNGRCIRRNIA